MLKQLRAQPLPSEMRNQVEAAVKSLEDGHTTEAIPRGLEALFHASVQPYPISWFRYDPSREIARSVLAGLPSLHGGLIQMP